MNRARNVLAWVTAFLAFAAVYLGMSIIGDRIGVPMSFDVDPFEVSYGRGAEGQISSLTTAFGWGANVLCVLVGVIAWHLVHARRFTPNGTADFYGWLIGSLIMLVGSVPLWLFLKEPVWLGNLAELGLLGVAIYLGMHCAKVARTPSQG